MISRRLLPLLLLAVAAPALAQDPVPDTTSAWRYYPLAPGNVWEYRNTEASELRGYARYTITGDTLIEGRRYFLRLQEQLDATGVPTGTATEAIRFDTLTASVNRWTGTEEQAITCSLDASFDSKIDCSLYPYVSVYGGYGQTVMIGSSAVTTSRKDYDTGPFEDLFTYAAGIGEWRYSYFGLYVKDLTYARIDGVAYGEPFPVAAEAGPEPVSALSLAVRPNPSSGAASAVLTVRRPQRVSVALYDVLGRRVAFLYAGALGVGSHAFPLGAAGLPAGTYVVRAAGEDGVATARAVVR